MTGIGRLHPHRVRPRSSDGSPRPDGCVAIIAHPFRNSTLSSAEADFDAIEINGKHPEHRRRIEAIAAEREIPVVGGSDAHFPFEVGRVATRLEIDRLTPTTVVDAIREGRVAPTFRDGPFLRGLRSLYARVHDLKSHAAEPPRRE